VREIIRANGVTQRLGIGALVFEQGRPHDGIFIVEQGTVRTFYTASGGKEITLAYWSEGHLVGGPELFGRGLHVWSAAADTPCIVTWIRGETLKLLASKNAEFAMKLIEALIVKGRCYSSLAQILGTTPARGRLAELLLTLADRGVKSAPDGGPRKVPRYVTHEQLAAIIGSTRQWVTATLSRFEREGLILIRQDAIVILKEQALRKAHAS
jgi:CRP-like cAMP-binding protein